MMFVTGALTALSRLMGGVATMTVGSAVILLFGRVPGEKRTLLSFIALGSLAWLDFAPVDAKLVIPYADWETLYRLRLQAEHGTGPGAEA